MFFKTYWILWLNARTLDYIREYNDSSAKKLADSKLKTKDFLSAKWVSVVDTLLVVKSVKELEKLNLDDLKTPFVVKPNAWFWGKWILIVDSKDASWNFVLNNWNVLTKEEMLSHFQFILEWFFSLSWNRDKVIIEKKIILNSQIELLWKFGLPDLRIIVFNMVPVMAMFRIPTKESKWKANLHAWACWVWVDIWTWKLTYITYKWKSVKSIPWIWDVRWIELPDWEKVLELAVKVQEITKVWYLGCDIVLDKEAWPLLLEMNIRPWLAVQLANLAPLKTRLKKVTWVFVDSVKKWVRLWKDLFGGNIEEKIQNISWKKVVWIKEYVSLFYNEKKYKYLAYIKPSISLSQVDKNFLIDIVKIPEKSIEKKDKIKLELDLLWVKKKINFKISQLKENKIILWQNALKWFLLDPFKYKKNELPIDLETIKKLTPKNALITKKYEELLINLDKKIIKIDKKLILLKYLKPINLEEQEQIFIEKKWDYLPKFIYPEIKLDLENLKKEVLEIEVPDIPLSKIYKDKKEEILNKINLLEALKIWDSKKITSYSINIFGDIIEENLEYSKKIMAEKWDLLEEENLSKEEIKDLIKKFNHIYNIKISLIERVWGSRFAMRWNNLMIRKWALVWKRELRSIIAHEIEWHYLRSLNAKKIPYKIFSSWTAFYLATEEGIAIYNQSRFLKKIDAKYYSIFEKYFFMNYAKNHSTEKLKEKMLEYYNNDYKKVFNHLLRIKRWFKNFWDSGFFAKDLVYTNWFLQVRDFLENGWNLRELYIWKIKIEDLEEIKSTNILKINSSEIVVPFFV